MTVNSSVNCVILIVFALSDNLSAENSSCLRSSATAKTTFLDVCSHHHKDCLYILLFRVAGEDIVLGFDDMAGLVKLGLL